MKLSEKVHFGHPEKIGITVCGKIINGVTLRYASSPKNVTCKQCLVFLTNNHVCSKCGHFDKKIIAKNT